MSWLPPPLRYAYISPAGLANLRHYKYHCVDRSLVAYYVGQPFWNWCVTLLPSWMAPNLVTLVGLCCMLLSYAVVAFHLPRCTGILPPWACVLAAVCTFAYQTLDAIDGKQARRTGSSSPLGELFDHGCDAVTTAVMSMALAATADMGGGVHGLEGVEGAVLLAVLLAGFIVFYLAQWEEYHTDVMTLGYFGVTELHLLVALLYLWTAVMGGAWWRDGPRLLGVLRPTHVLAAASLLGSLSTAATSAVQVAIFYARKQSHSHTRSAEHAALYARRRAALWWHLVPMVVLVGSAILWTTSSPQRILASHPHVFAMVLGFCFSYVVVRYRKNSFLSVSIAHGLSRAVWW